MIRFNRVDIAIFCLLLGLSFSGCLEKNTNNPIRAFKYWAGEKPSKDFKVINGKYWESSHWSKEYVLYLEMIAPKEWIEGYKLQNNFREIKVREELPDNIPAWFNPPKTYKTYTMGGFSDGSTFFEDSATGHLFIYEIQL
jgi:hypothetical protein